MPESVYLAAALSSAHQRRLKWALQSMSQALMTALQRDRSPEAVHLRKANPHDQADLIGRLIMERADPAANKRFTPWLVREYAAGRLILEDLGTANETLSLFLRYAPRLKPEQRDIQRYSSLAAAWEVVRRFADRDEARSNKAQKALDRAKAYEESRILRQDPNGYTVAVPLTEFAAKWWGKGTRWCTASRDRSAFGAYYEIAPLIVIQEANGNKYQLWVSHNHLEFRDAADRDVSQSMGKLLGPFSEPFGLLMARLFGNGLHLLPERLLTREICEDAIQKNAMALEFVPEALKSADICRIAVFKNGGALRFVPASLQSVDICAIAIEQDPLNLGWVKPEHVTKELCVLAAHAGGVALHHVPMEMRDYPICLSAVSSYGLAIIDTPPAIIDLELCLVAVKQNPSAAAHVPSEIRETEEFWRTLVERRIQFRLSDVPIDLRSKELCHYVLSHFPFDITHLPRWKWGDATKEALYEVALRGAGMAIEGIPILERTPNLCMIAVKRDGRAIANVPEWLLTPELCLEATRQHWTAINFIKEAPNAQTLMTPALIDSALSQSGRALLSIPDNERTYDRCIQAVANHPDAIFAVPNELLDDNLFRAVKTRDAALLRFYSGRMSATLKKELESRRQAIASTLEASVETSSICKTYWPPIWLDEWAKAAGAAKPEGHPVPSTPDASA